MIVVILRKLSAFVLLLTASVSVAQPSEACRNCLSQEQAQEDLRFLYENLASEHVDLFTRRTKDEYNEHVEALVGRIEGPVLRHEFDLILHQAMAFGNIAHAKTDAGFSAFFAHVNDGGSILPLSVVYHDDRMVTDEWAGAGDTLPPGSQIVRIGGLSLSEFEGLAKQIISADTERLLRSQIELGLPVFLHLVFGSVEELSVEYQRPSGITGLHTIKAMPLPAMRAMQLERHVPSPARVALERTYRAMDDGVFYLQPGPFFASEEEGAEPDGTYSIKPFQTFIEDAFAAVATSGATDLLIDLRDNPGGDASFSDLMTARLTNSPYKFASRYEVRAGSNTKAKWTDWKGDPDSFAGRVASAIASAKVGERVAVDLPETAPIVDNAFAGRTWLLLNRYSFSNAAVVAALMQDLQIATVLGEKTADLPTTYAAVETFELPNSGRTITYPKAYMVRPSGSEEVRGVEPDFRIEPTEIGQADDTMLATALEHIRQSR